MDPYKVLDVEPQASEQDIKQAFRKKALECHPDRQSTGFNKEEIKQKFQEVVNAYEILKEPIKRDKLDEARAAGRPFNTADVEKPPDPLGERFARYWEESQKKKQKVQNQYVWTDQQATDWEELLRDAEEVKARRARQRVLWQAAYTKRVSNSLGKHWQTHPGITRYDIYVATFFLVGCGAIAAAWRPLLLQNQENLETGACQPKTIDEQRNSSS